MDGLSESARKYLESRDAVDAQTESAKDQEDAQLKDRDRGFEEIAQQLESVVDELQKQSTVLRDSIHVSRDENKISVRDRNYVGNLRKAFLHASSKDPGLLFDGGVSSVTISFLPVVNDHQVIEWYRYVGHGMPPGTNLGNSSEFADKILAGVYKGKFFELYRDK